MHRSGTWLYLTRIWPLGKQANKMRRGIFDRINGRTRIIRWLGLFHPWAEGFRRTKEGLQTPVVGSCTLPFPLEEQVGADDEEAAKEQLEGDFFVGVIQGGEPGNPSGQEEGEDAGEDRFGAVNDRGLRGGNVRLPLV